MSFIQGLEIGFAEKNFDYFDYLCVFTCTWWYFVINRGLNIRRWTKVFNFKDDIHFYFDLTIQVAAW